jgi:para-aminobenzoate synthetase component 1
VKSTTEQFTLSDFQVFKTKMLNWANRFNIFCFLDTNGYHEQHGSIDCVLAAGCRRSLEMAPGNAFRQLQSFYDAQPSWLFGHLGYALKNEIESLNENKVDLVGFGPGFFFEPEIIVRITGEMVEISGQQTSDPQRIFKEIQETCLRENTGDDHPERSIHSSLTRNEYLAVIEKLRQHIRRGDCYEINFCQHFFVDDIIIEPLLLYNELVKNSPNPFGAFYKFNDKYCLCASPERYLKKEGEDIISQPIKGTSRRSLQDPELDERNRQYLLNSSKEKSENVMVVDLVRNDLSRICEEGSVQVEELFGVYSFPQVHQMISTVRGKVKTGVHFTEAIKATFPMGSMTGAPTIRVIVLIDEYEATGRGLFSGSIGYITPAGDFDFNVVIRSIFYNCKNKYLSFSAGSGITFYSEPSKEFDECMLKAEAIRGVLRKLANVSFSEDVAATPPG